MADTKNVIQAGMITLIIAVMVFAWKVSDRGKEDGIQANVIANLVDKTTKLETKVERLEENDTELRIQVGSLVIQLKANGDKMDMLNKRLENITEVLQKSLTVSQ